MNLMCSERGRLDCDGVFFLSACKKMWWKNLRKNYNKISYIINKSYSGFGGTKNSLSLNISGYFQKWKCWSVSSLVFHCSLSLSLLTFLKCCLRTVVIQCLAAFQVSARAGSPIGCCNMALTWANRRRGPSTAGTRWRKLHQVHQCSLIYSRHPTSVDRTILPRCSHCDGSWTS